MAKPAPETVPNPPARKVGLALGSGSARGMAHIGVLRAIEEAGIKVDLVAGTSMGAVVGAVYAAGKMAGLADRFRAFDWRQIAGLLDPVLPRSGLIDGQRIADFVRAHVAAANIEDLPIPFRAVATCIMSGEEVACASGDLIDAVRASISVPGIFTPVRSNGRILVDGRLVNPVPVSVARAMGADRVIAVDLNHDIVAGRVSRPDSNSQGTFHNQASLRQDKPDILIRPPLGAVRFMEFDRAEEIIEIGYRSAAQQLARWAGAPTDD